LNSKNDQANVLEVLEKHPEMVLRREHFAAMRINWEDKPGNLRSMAEELNLGLDSFVFVDDHPVECEMMRTALPEVTCIQLPPEPALFEQTLRSLDCFDQLSITKEDRKRGELYRAETSRRELASATMDLPTFYRQLEMVMSVSVDDPVHVGRAAQMTQRTNQFNMNTIRCTEDEIRAWVNNPSYRMVTLGLADKFGDNGVIGLAVIKIQPSAWHLHIFLMSCRVLGRTVEQLFVRWIAQQAAKVGVKQLTATYKPTAKNTPFAGFYHSCGFIGPETGSDTWTLDLTDAKKDIPDYIRLIENPSWRGPHVVE
jgi:FkbH-like protein